MAYTPQFTPTYPNGWVDFPSEETLVTAAALQAYDDTLENIEEYLEEFDPNNNLADQYDPEDGTYAVDDYCVYEDTLYQCNTAISEPEDFDPEKWDEVKITDVMGGGGGGSTVSITPTLSTGTKIADFEIDGESGELYAPTGGGGSANIWTGTMAEYEAQASQIPNDTLVNITDDEGEIEVGGEYYSTDERCIGTWTDGKPLYQKTVSFSSLSNGNTKIDNTVSLSIISLINVEGVAFLSDGQNEVAIPYATSNQATSAFLSDGLYVHVNNLSIASGYVTIKYTKNTDSPIPLATKTTPSYEVYSTDEQIIGQWIDGSPIYRKVLPSTNVGQSGVTITHNLGVKQYINVYGSCTVNGQTNPLPFPFFQIQYSTSIAISTASANAIEIICSWNNSTVQLVVEYTKTSS